MVNTGYLFSTSIDRLFINTSLGCSANCSYCYLPLLKHSKGKKVNNYITAEKIIEELEKNSYYKPGKNGTLISFGCYSECWDRKNKPQTIKLIKYFINKGNKIQFSTKKYVNYQDLIDIKNTIKYPGQLTIFISCATITNSHIFENKTTEPKKRFKSFEINGKLHIPTILYIKPVIYNITIKDIHNYINIIKKYNIKDVVVGSMIKKNGTGEIAPFIDNNSLHTEPNNQEKEIIQKLSKICNIYKKSIDVIKNYQ